MKRIVMMPGDVWGRLTVVREEGDKVLCRCECGNEGFFSRKHVRSGHTSSCGCFRRERASIIASSCKHGMSHSGTYNSWSNAKARCLNPGHESFPDYGGRGIAMCDRWIDSFENFLADMGERPKGMTLERRDVDGPYSPTNCEWASRLDQTRNRRNTVRVEYQGITKALGEWCDVLGLVYASAHQMIKNGKSVDAAFESAQRRESAKVAA